MRPISELRQKEGVAQELVSRGALVGFRENAASVFGMALSDQASSIELGTCDRPPTYLSLRQIHSNSGEGG